MPRPRHKGKRSLTGRHVQLPEYLQATEAWRTLKAGPRALYVELKRRFNGSNNGDIFLSHRDAAKAINVTKNTVGPYFDELESRGFIRKVTGGYLGPDGYGKAAVWALDEERTIDGKPAMKRFMAWEMQKPVPKTGSARPKKRDGFLPNKQGEAELSQIVGQKRPRSRVCTSEIGTHLHVPLCSLQMTPGPPPKDARI